MISHEDGGLHGRVYQTPVFAELAGYVCESIVMTGRPELRKGEKNGPNEPRTLVAEGYDVPNGYNEGPDLRLSLAADYSEWGGLGDSMDVAKKVETIRATIGQAGVPADDIVVTLGVRDFVLGKDRARDMQLVYMVANVFRLASAIGEPDDEVLMPLTDARIEIWQQKAREQYEQYARRETKRREAELAEAAQRAARAETIRAGYEQPDFTGSESPLPPPLEEDPDVAANKSVVAMAAAETPKTPRKDDQDFPVRAEIDVPGNGYSTEQFVADSGARQLSDNQRWLIIRLCLAIDQAKIKSYRHGFRQEPDMSRTTRPYIVRGAVEKLPVGPAARSLEVFFTAEAKRATVVAHPEWFDGATPGLPDLYWIDQVGERITVGTTARAIPGLGAECFSTPGEVASLTEAVRGAVIDRYEEIFAWNAQSGRRFSKTLREMNLSQPGQAAADGKRNTR